MYHLHWVVGRSRGSPYFASSRQRVAPPPTLHDLEGAPKWTRVGPPQPFTTWSASQTDKGQGFDPPQPFTTWSGSANGQGFDPPNPSRLGAAPQMAKGLTPPTLHDLEQLPNGQGFFTTWSGSQMNKGWTPPNRIGLPNPSRLGGCSFPGS